MNDTVRNNCIDTADGAMGILTGAFAGRGLAGGARSEEAEQERRELRSRLENPGSYIYEDILKNDFSNRYRSGIEGGRSFMTVDDLRRLRADEERRRESPRGRAVAELSREVYSQRISTDARPAHAYEIRDARGVGDRGATGGRREAVYGGGSLITGERSGMTYYSGESETEMIVSGVRRKKGRLSEMFRESVRADRSVRAGGGYRASNGFFAAVAMVLVFAFVLALPITLSVLKHSEATKLAKIESEIRAREAEISTLRIELEKKNDLFLLERTAVEKYGMIELDKSVYNLIRINPADSVVNVENTGSRGIMPALLSALGLRGEN